MTNANTEQTWTNEATAYLAACEADAEHTAMRTAMRLVRALDGADAQPAYEAIVRKAAAAKSHHAREKLSRLARAMRIGLDLAPVAVAQPGLRGADGK